MPGRLLFEYDPCDDDIFLVGKGGSGKTFLLKMLLLALYSGPAWIWYPERRDDGLPEYVRELGWQVVGRVDELPYGRALLYPRDKSIEVFDKFCKKAIEHTNLTVIVDEAHSYVGKYKFKSKGYQEIVNKGRPRGVCMVNVARRPQQMHNDILADADHIFCFDMDLPGDITFMEKWIGPLVEGFLAPDERKPQYRNVPGIGKYGFVYRNMKTGLTEVANL